MSTNPDSPPTEPARIRCSCHKNCGEVLAKVVDGAIVIRTRRHGQDHEVKLVVPGAPTLVGGIIAW